MLGYHNNRSFGEASRVLHKVVLLRDRGVYFGHQEHPRWALHCFTGLHDSQVMGREHGSTTSQDYQRTRTPAPAG